jgi:hypothetical protein
MMTEQQRLDLAHRISANYFFWQGLRWVPLGFALLLLSILPRGSHPLAVSMFVIGIALAVSLAAGRTYKRRFARARRLAEGHAQRERWKWFVVYPLMFLALVWDIRSASMFFVTGPVWGGAIAAYWWSTGRGRLHYIPIAIAVALTGLLPTVGLIPPGKPMLNVFFAVIGATYVIAGILDHLELARVLPPLRRQHHGRSV